MNAIEKLTNYFGAAVMAGVTIEKGFDYPFAETFDGERDVHGRFTYHGGKGTAHIWINADTERSEDAEARTLYHEFGHYLDFLVGMRQTVISQHIAFLHDYKEQVEAYFYSIYTPFYDFFKNTRDFSREMN